ncbi:hypothetical protein PF005_g25063 [Phytophthora fragariae]|uniref:Uncharacterized protein n=1 Tax=Phytophthora fragariae TaxID=53985 RepID=A0A6A3ED29_9STRA|nr:hypothetical protein PF003_g35763 [Phytophthora fragariae]KAE8931465.1 hypothetical protein PF009_g18474 [Phytophthora fragariae]KAE9095209.1 hypothetical protein PF007_g17455 [Phytophthora fragariae]KAE9096410.1 hypothetical protein PF006_g23786 [Phytophthora fragariae]KAE9170291.1 hypothetical protein PF002_g30129 [Phytophthora fragariae]
MPENIQAFWGTFAWADNPWIPDSNAPSLQRSKYNRIEVTPTASLGIVRTARDIYEARTCHWAPARKPAPPDA